MSTWTNEFDICRDLDRLSGFRQSNVSYPSFHAYGRGKIVIQEDARGRKTKVAQFTPLPQVPRNSTVRQCNTEEIVSSKIQNGATWDLDTGRDLTLQLRQIGLARHSNELIEEEFGYKKSPSPDQLNDSFEDVPTENPLEVAVTEPKPTVSPLSSPPHPQQQTSSSGLSSECPRFSDCGHSGTKLFVHPPKLKPRRNALLNSIARMKHMAEEQDMIDLPNTSSRRGTEHTAEGVCSTYKTPSGSDLSSPPSHSDTEDSLTTSKMDLQKIIEPIEISKQGQSCEEEKEEAEKSQRISWADIRKRKPVHCGNGTVLSGITRRSPRTFTITPPNAFPRRGTECAIGGVNSTYEAPSDNDFTSPSSHSDREDNLTTSKLDSQKIMEPMEMYEQEQSCEEGKNQCISWADIRKRKPVHRGNEKVLPDVTRRSSRTQAIALSTSFPRRGTECTTGEDISTCRPPSFSDFNSPSSHSGSEDKLRKSALDSHKMIIEPMEMSKQRQTCEDEKRLCVNWANIGKHKPVQCDNETVLSGVTQRSSQTHTISPTSTFPRGRTECTRGGVNSTSRILSDSGSTSLPSHSDTEDNLTKPVVDPQKMIIEHLKISEHGLSCEKEISQCISWANIRKCKAVHGSNEILHSSVKQRTSPTHAVSFQKSMVSEQDSRKKSVGSTNVLNFSDLPDATGYSQDKKHYMENISEVSQHYSNQNQAINFPYVAKNISRKAKENQCSSSPCNLSRNGPTVVNEVPWFSLRKNSTCPKNVQLDTFTRRRTECTPEGVNSTSRTPSGSDLTASPSHSTVEDNLMKSEADPQKMIKPIEILKYGQSSEGEKSQCISWADIRKRKPVHCGNETLHSSVPQKTLPTHAVSF